MRKKGAKRGKTLKRGSKRGANPKRIADAHVHTGWRPDIEVLFLVGVVVAALLLVSPAMAQDGEAKIRMAHLSPDAPAVMVELDGEPVEDLANVSYKDSTPYLPIPAGPHDIAVFSVADPSEPVLEVSIAPEAGESYTVAGVGLLEDDTFGARLFEDDDTEPAEGKARVRVIHAVPDVGPATVGVEDGPDLFALPGFANASDYAGVDAGTYTLDVTPAGAESPAFAIPDVEVEEGEIYTAFAVGQASEGTFGTILTVDSDNGKVVGPQSLQDTSGDLSLLESEGDADNSAKDEPSQSDEAKTTPDTPPAEAPPENNDSSAAEPNAAPEAVVPEAEAPAPVESAPAPVETAQAPVVENTPAPVETAQAPPVVEQVVAEPVLDVAPQPVVSTFVVPQPAPVEVAPAAAAPAAAAPAAAAPVEAAPVAAAVEAAPVEVPPVEVPPVEVPPVAVPEAPVAAVSETVSSVASQTAVQNTTQTATQNVTQSVNQTTTSSGGFVSATPPPAATAAVQSVSQQTTGGNMNVQAPVDAAVGIAISTPAVVNSGARRKFVTIRRRNLPGSA